MAEAAEIVRTLPSNHSSLFAPVVEPTLRTGVAALARAARAWLPAVGPRGIKSRHRPIREAVGSEYAAWTPRRRPLSSRVLAT